MISIAGTTLLRFSSGSPMPIITTLVMGRTPVVFTAPTIFAARQTWPIISDTRRLRLKPCWAVEQNLHSSAQPTSGGDAQGGAVFFRDIDGLDALIANGNRPFNGPVG